jgi:hypothetical protein
MESATIVKPETLAEAVARAVAAAPPLTRAQRDTLTAAFAGVTPPIALRLPAAA